MPGAFLFLIAILQFLRGKYYPALILFFLLLTAGFQFIPSGLLMAGLTSVKSSDFAVAFIAIAAWVRRKYIKDIIREYPIFKWCLYVFGFAVLEIFYSYFILHYDIINVLQVFRQYVLLLSFIPFFFVPNHELKRIFQSLALITVAQSVLFLAQIATGHALLLSSTGDENVVTGGVSGSNYVRFYNLPAFLVPTLYYYLFVFKSGPSFIRFMFIAILLVTVVGPLHRSLIMGVVAVISIYVLLKQTSSNRMIYMSVIGLGIYAASFIDVLNKRIEGAFSDLWETFNTRLSVSNIDINENTSLFRVGHLLERLTYVLASPMRWIFGIGLISDHAPYAANLPFQFGLQDPVTGQIIQIDTSDLSWSPLVLTMGLVGTVLYTLLFVKFLVAFFRKTNIDPYNIMGFLTVLTALLLSMSGAEFLSPTFRVAVILMAVIGFTAEPKESLSISI